MDNYFELSYKASRENHNNLGHDIGYPFSRILFLRPLNIQVKFIIFLIFANKYNVIKIRIAN